MRNALTALEVPFTEETIRKVTEFQADLLAIAMSGATASSARYSFHDLQNTLPAVSWRILLHDFNTLPILISQSEKQYLLSLQYVKKAHELMQKDPQTTANYLGWKVVQHLLPHTTAELREEAFQLDNVTYQVPRQKDLKEKCTQETITAFRFAVGKLFYDIVAAKEERTGVELIMSYVRRAFFKRLNESDWLDDQTRAAALQKLKGLIVDYYLPSAFSLRVSWDRRPPYADIDSFYSEVQTPKVKASEFTFVSWILEVSRFQYQRSLRELMVRKEEDVPFYFWDRIPTDFTAAYVTNWNLVIVPVSVLSGPWYKRSRPEAMNFGGLGFVLGHELAHAFDPTSFQYNFKGEKRIEDWSPACREEHASRSKCFVNQYRGFKFMDQPVDPERTLIENIADSEGLRLAFEAFQLFRQNHPEMMNRRLPLDMSRYTDEQLFFLSFANVRRLSLLKWC